MHRKSTATSSSAVKPEGSSSAPARPGSTSTPVSSLMAPAPKSAILPGRTKTATASSTTASSALRASWSSSKPRSVRRSPPPPMPPVARPSPRPRDRARRWRGGLLKRPGSDAQQRTSRSHRRHDAGDHQLPSPRDRGDVKLAVAHRVGLGSYTLSLNAEGRQLVTDWISGATTNHGLVLGPESSKDSLKVSSREGATAPLLRIVYSQSCSP